MNKKFWIGGLAVLILIIAGITGISINKENKKPDPAIVSGTFKGRSEGDQGEIRVDVVIKNNVITHIEILEHNETPGLSKAMVQLADNIVAKNSLDVDIIAGATVTSKSFLAAVGKSLEEAGLNPEDLVPAEEALPSKASIQTECDILIIGGGGAGFSAAIEAASKSGSRIIVLEKMSFGGGNTRMSGGEYAAPGNWVQQAEGINGDSQELFYQDIYEGGGKKGNPALIRILSEQALPNALWLRDFVGVEYKDYQSWYGGHSLARTLWPVGDGPAYIDTLIDKAQELGVDVHYNTRAVTLIRNPDGRVSGVRATRMGETIDYTAAKGVILTTGGFGANVEMRMEYDTRWKTLDETIPTTNSPAIAGDGIIMAKQIGANLVGMEDIQLYPVNNPATGNYYFMDYARINANALLLNQEGQRFVDEKETRDNLSTAILAQTDSRAYELIDSRVIKNMNLEYLYENELEKCLRQGVLAKGSLEDCCDFFNLPADEVRETIKSYNEFAAAGVDADFGRTEHLEAISSGPYIMFSCIVSVHHTMGGVEIDEFARVIDTEGNPIVGLYAAGEVTGGIHGSNRLGSMSMPDTVTFGRIAAQSAIHGR